MIYYYGGVSVPIYLLLAYAKSARSDLTPTERRTVATLAAAIKATGKERK